MASREARESRIPSYPIAMPPVTGIAVNWRGVPPASFILTFTTCACRFSADLQGAAPFRQAVTPITGR